jgi:hypothetical protein
MAPVTWWLNRMMDGCMFTAQSNLNLPVTKAFLWHFSKEIDKDLQVSLKRRLYRHIYLTGNVSPETKN